MPLPDIIAELIERFEANRASYTAAAYNETQTRQEFINPFFTALGWDVDNTQGFAEAYKDVIHEDAIKVGGVTKAPDYSFRIGGTRKFFLEAKKPSVVLKFEKSAAFQLRRYAWSAKLPLSILTNFAELAVYDCRFEPNKDDPSSKARLFHFSYKDYAEKWDEIADKFSKTAVLKGSFDKFAESSKGKRGTAEVDAAFLAQIEAWRDLLARNLALRNPDLSQRDLNFAVQRTIDRIVFLRICEDRGMESYGALQALLNGTNCYPRLCELFHAADERYNSGLFHFASDKARPEEPDGLTLKLGIDDKTLKDILRGLYYPDSPYVFSVIPADILGQAYEQFLGKVIRLTSGHRAVIEDKPEVKKAGGVYYTPTYIVDYIVQNTLGKLLDGKTPKEAAKLRVLDPACGSGSFLIGAFQFLLDWHRDWYVANGGASKHKKELYEGPGGLWQLTSATRKSILRNSIYGVDIDAQAVEVTKLSLLLKVLEGESAETLNSNLKLFKERALPDLGDNIKCGNSLIGPDFFELPQAAGLSQDELLRINPFDWSAEFKAIMQGGGFDAVIGNPPYRMLQPHNIERYQLDYLKSKYIAAEFKIDLFHLFLQKSVNVLIDRGLLGFIIPSSLLNNVYAENLRSWITERCCIESISVASERVFPTADVHTSVFIYRRESNKHKRDDHKIAVTTQLNKTFDPISQNFSYTRQNRFEEIPGKVWNVLINEKNAALILRLVSDFSSLKKLGTVNRGLITGDKSEFIAKEKKSPQFVPILSGADIHRYSTDPYTEYVLFERPANAGGCWDPEVHLAPHKLVIRQIGKHPTASMIAAPIAVTGNIFMFRTDETTEKYLLGIINSKLIDFFWQIMFADFKSSFPQVTVFSLNQLPIRTINFDDPTDKAKHDKMVALVETMLKLHQELPGRWGRKRRSWSGRSRRRTGRLTGWCTSCTG